MSRSNVTALPRRGGAAPLADQMLTRAEVGVRLGLSPWAVGKLIRRGELAEYRLGYNVSRVAEADLATYINSKRRTA